MSQSPEVHRFETAAAETWPNGELDEVLVNIIMIQSPSSQCSQSGTMDEIGDLHMSSSLSKPGHREFLNITF